MLHGNGKAYILSEKGGSPSAGTGTLSKFNQSEMPVTCGDEKDR